MAPVGWIVGFSVSLCVNLIFIVLFSFLTVLLSRLLRSLRGCIGNMVVEPLPTLPPPPEIVPLTYDVQIARYLAQLVRVFASGRDSFVDPFFTKEADLMPANIGCVLRDARNRIWIVFRGTRTKEEAYRDGQFEQREGIHLGFCIIFHSVFQTIKDNMHDVQQVIVSGHSLGAALATLTVAGLEIENMVGYIFGSPRVGDPAFCARFGNRHLYSICNSADIITDLPPAVAPNFKNPGHPFLYAHAGVQVIFTKNEGTWLQNHLMPLYESYLTEQELLH